MIEQIREFWNEAMEMREARWIVALFGLAVCVTVAVYVVKRFRDMAIGGSGDTVSHLTEFQRLHEEGKLDKEEYDRLKSTIPRNISESVLPTGKQAAPDFSEVKDPTSGDASNDNE